MCVNDPFESNYQLLIKGCKKVEIGKIKKNSTKFIEYSKAIDDVFEKLEDYNLTKKMKAFIVFGGVIADTEANKKLSLVSKGKKIPRFVCFYITTFFQST